MRWNIDLVVYYKQVEIKFPWHLIVLLLTNNEPIMLGKIQIPPSCIYSDNKNLSVDVYSHRSALQVFYWYKIIMKNDFSYQQNLVADKMIKHLKIMIHPLMVIYNIPP